MSVLLIKNKYLEVVFVKTSQSLLRFISLCQSRKQVNQWEPQLVFVESASALIITF